MPSQQTDTLVDLGEYLWHMSEKLDCYYTLEDVPLPGHTDPSRIWSVSVEPDLDIESIDALVAKLDQELQDYDVVRSTKYPSVVHFIAKDLLGQGYLMDQEVSVEYSGKIMFLPDHLGTLLDGEMQTKSQFNFGGGYPTGDWTTEVEIDVENETVRDVLTGAVPLAEYSMFPLEQYGPWLWESIYVADPEQPDFTVLILDSPYAEPISLWDYLVETADKLGCYFTLEDRFNDHPYKWYPRAYYASVHPNIAPEPEVETIEAMVEKLQEELGHQGYQVVRSTKFPSVIHIIAEDLLEEGYLMEQQVSLGFSGTTQGLADHLGTLLDGRVGAYAGGVVGYPLADYTTEVEVDVEDQSVRDVLTGAVPGVPLEEYSPILWQAIYAQREGHPDFTVVFRTPWWEEEEPEE